jgi:dTDP-4-dehydrorhamnose reductase
VPLLPIDLTKPQDVAAAFRRSNPDVIIHTAALARLDECFRNPSVAEAINVQATRHLVQLARKTGTRFVYVSTDLVFDGEKGNYSESDHPSPISVYGNTNDDAER